MYQPSNSPIFANQAAKEARQRAASDARIAATRLISATGRAQLFNTLLSPDELSRVFGSGTGLNAASMQAQTETARGTGLLGTGGGYDGSTAPQMSRARAPEVVSMAQRPSCGPSSPLRHNWRTETGAHKPGMPQMAPAIVNTPNGPLHYLGAASTVPGSYESPLIAPPVEPPGFMGWIGAHPWLSLAIAGGGVYLWGRK